MLLGLAVAGCSSDDTATLAEGEGGGAEELTDSYVTLNFTMAFAGQGTRADNPTGGEDSGEKEDGQTYENEISSAVAFLYQGDAANGINRTDNPTVTPVVFSSVTLQDDGTYTTSPERVTLPTGEYHIIVVANPGTNWWSADTDLRLDDVRDHIQETAWTENGGEYSDFLMSLEGDASLSLELNPMSAPATAKVDVERMAARIDYKPVGSIDCKDKTGSVEILGAAIVNDYNAGSYLLKRVAPSVGGDVTYLGDEVAGTDANYVIDPKTDGSKTAEDYADGTYYPNIIDTQTYYADPNVWASFVTSGTNLTIDGETWNRIGYTMENTSKTDADIEKTNTGVVFRAQFAPAAKTVKGNYDYDNPSTFFSYRGVLYASMEDVMKAFYGEDAFNGFDAKIGECTSWENVKAFVAENLNVLDPSGYYKYLNDKVAGNETFPENAKGLKWSEYMLAMCGYSSTTADNKTTVKLDQNNKTTRVALRPYGVSTYKDATCYYTWWVKHSNDGDDTKTGPMEYAIVRNNIYKLTVTSVAGLGGDVPGGTPESGDDIVIRVNVKDWTLLKPEEIIM